MLLALSAALGLEPDVAGPVLVDDRGREALDALVGRAAAQGFEDAIGLLHQDCQDQEEAERPEGSASSLAENEEEAPEASAQAAAEQPTVAQAAAEQPTVAPAAAEQPTVAPAAAEQPTVAQAAAAQADVAPAVWRRVGNDVLAPDGRVLGTVHSILAPDGRTRSLKATCRVHPAKASAICSSTSLLGAPRGRSRQTWSPGWGRPGSQPVAPLRNTLSRRARSRLPGGQSQAAPHLAERRQATVMPHAPPRSGCAQPSAAVTHGLAGMSPLALP